MRGDRAIQWNGDPWTDNQVTLAMVAIFLAICCLIIFTIDQLHNHIIAQASEDSVTHLMFALGAKGPVPTKSQAGGARREVDSRIITSLR